MDDEIHKDQINIAIEKVKAWGLNVDVIGLWVSDKWTVEKII